MAFCSIRITSWMIRINGNLNSPVDICLGSLTQHPTSLVITFSNRINGARSKSFRLRTKRKQTYSKSPSISFSTGCSQTYSCPSSPSMYSDPSSEPDEDSGSGSEPRSDYADSCRKPLGPATGSSPSMYSPNSNSIFVRVQVCLNRTLSRQI